MSEDILNKIKYLCRAIPDVEWSGILFYSVEGSITEPDKMEITLQDILPMHKGTKAYTEYTFDERVIDFFEADEAREDWKMGHIHSHNTMDVFFSGTDMSELRDNSENHNYYLSLIVNNWMDFTAKVAFRAKGSIDVEAPINARNEKGEYYKVSSVTTQVEKEIMYHYDCEIDTPEEGITVSEEFEKFADRILAEAEEREKAAKRPVFTGNTASAGTSVTYGKDKPLGRLTGLNQKYVPPIKKDLGKYQGQSWNRGLDTNSKLRQSSNEDDDFDWKQWEQDTFEEKAAKGVSPSPREIEQFTVFVLRNGKMSGSYESVDDALEEIKAFDVDPHSLASQVVTNYPRLFKEFFNEEFNEMDEADFVSITDLVIEELDDALFNNYKLVQPVINVLKGVLDKYDLQIKE